MSEPRTIARCLIQSQKRAPHRQRVGQIGPGEIFRIVPESAAVDRTIGKDIFRRCNGFVQILLIASGCIERGHGFNRPTVFARVSVLVNARHALFAARFVAQFEICRAVLALNQVRILAGVERSLGAGKKRLQETLNILRGLQVRRIVPFLISQRVNTQVPGLHGHDLFEVGLIPIAAH